MSANRITLDTNILVYAFDATAGERHLLATKVMEQALADDCLLTLQVLDEFFSVLTRKKAVSIEVAKNHITDLGILFPVVAAKPETLSRALKAVTHHHMALWNAMLWATAREANTTILLSEDFQHEQLLDGVRMINPFLPNKFWSVC